MQDQDRIPVFMSYLGFVALLPPYVAYFFLTESKYARFHARQGIHLTFVFLVGLVILGIVKYAMMRTGMPIRYVYLSYGLWFFVYIFLNLLAAIFGLLGKAWGIPVLSYWNKPPKTN